MVQKYVFSISGGDGCRGIAVAANIFAAAAAAANIVSAECASGKTWNEKRL
jgi:hypothetical protein